MIIKVPDESQNRNPLPRKRSLCSLAPILRSSDLPSLCIPSFNHWEAKSRSQENQIFSKSRRHLKNKQTNKQRTDAQAKKTSNENRRIVKQEKWNVLNKLIAVFHSSVLLLIINWHKFRLETPQTTLTMLWRNALSITWHTHENLTSTLIFYLFSYLT